MMRLLCLIVLSLVGSQVYPATPSSKTFTKDNYTQDCGNGKRGIKCSEFENLEFNFNFPTQREDGSTLRPEEISHFVIQFEKDGGPTVQFAVPKTNNFSLLKMPSGSYVFRASTVDTRGTQGQFTTDQPVVIP